MGAVHNTGLSFHVFVVDHDKKIFNMFGPMYDDDEIHQKVTLLQEQGMDIRTFSTHNDPQVIIDKYTNLFGYILSDDKIIDY